MKGMRGGFSKGSAEDSVMGQAFDARLMKRLLGYLRPYIWYVLFALALLFVGVGADLAGPLLVKIGIDRHISVGDSKGLGTIVLLFIAVLMIGTVIRYLQLYITQWIGQRVVYDLRSKLFNHLQRQDIKFIDSRPVGWLMTRITGDVQSLYEMFSQGVVSVFGDVLTLVGIVVVLLVMNTKLALVTFIVVPLIFWLVFTFRSKVRVTFRIIREQLAHLNGFTQEHISGIRTVQLFSREKAVMEQFQVHNTNYRNAFFKAIRYFALFFPGISFISALATALILLAGGLMIHADTLTWGVLVAFIQYSERFFRPIRDLAERYNTMQAAMASAERIFWLLDSKPTIIDADSPKQLIEQSVTSTSSDNDLQREEEPVSGVVEFKNISFEYKSGEPIIQDISFKVNKGETVAIVGATGAGKTTLISLLLRFWDVTEGSILINGRDIRDYQLTELRALFGVVLQDVFLFSGTISDNITLGKPDRGGEVLDNALVQANAVDFIAALPSGVEEQVGERGARLSGGQKQLIAIARALAANPPILLLDEATAAVDSETERGIQQALDRLMMGRTTLVVAHRLSTIRNANRIVVMHKGKVREIGTHEELLRINGIYARLHRLQFTELNGVNGHK